MSMKDKLKKTEQRIAMSMATVLALIAAHEAAEKQGTNVDTELDQLVPLLESLKVSRTWIGLLIEGVDEVPPLPF